MTKYINYNDELELYPIQKDEDNKYITMESLDSNLKQSFSNEFKYILMRKSYETKDNTNIPDLDDIDYTKFYKLDNNLIKSAKIYNDDLYIYVGGNSYDVYHIKGVKYKGVIEYSIIPLGSVLNAEYIALNNNTFKLYGYGTLKVLGQINDITGQTSDEAMEYGGLKEFIYPEQITNPQNVKKTYFSTGTAYIIDENNDLWAWGENVNNKLGQGYSNNVTSPTKINENIKINDQQIKVKNVWAGLENTWILDTENRVWACGSNVRGTLGQGNTNTYKGYINITQIDGSRIKEIYPSLGEGYTLVEYTDGTVYGCGENHNGVLANGNYNNSNSFIKLDSYKNAKKIVSGAFTSYILTNSGDLYGCGYNGYGAIAINGDEKYSTFIKIASNVIDMTYEETYNSNILYKTNDGKIYVNGLYRYDLNNNRIYDVPPKAIEGINDSNIVIDNSGLMYSNGKMYIKNYNAESGNLTLTPYNQSITNVSEKVNSPLMRVFKSNGIYYMSDYPDITRIGKRVRITLKEVFNNAIFVQGMENYISIVDRDTNTWESLTYKNPQLTNAKKILSSPSAKYVLLNTGELYVKGDTYTGCWGDLSRKEEYVKVTKDGITPFNNIKDIFVTNDNDLLIFVTDDNEFYWAGRDSKLYFPGGIVGDINITSTQDKVTKYPRKLPINDTLSKIINDIKDINYTSYWSQESYSKSTYILTNDGDLYSTGDSPNTTGFGYKNYDFEKLTCFGNNKVKSIKSYNNYTIALLENGEVYAWGYNEYGQFGDGYDIGGVYPTPQKLALKEKIEKVTLGNGFTIFASSFGSVYGAGRNEYGQLGNGDNISTSKFVRCFELEK